MPSSCRRGKLVGYSVGVLSLVTVGCLVLRLLFERVQRTRDWLRVQKDAVREMRSAACTPPSRASASCG